MGPPPTIGDKFGKKYSRVQYNNTAVQAFYASPGNTSALQEGYHHHRLNYTLLPADEFKVHRRQASGIVVESDPATFLACGYRPDKLAKAVWVIRMGDTVRRVEVGRGIKSGRGSESGAIIEVALINSPSSAEDRAQAFELAVETASARRWTFLNPTEVSHRKVSVFIPPSEGMNLKSIASCVLFQNFYHPGIYILFSAAKRGGSGSGSGSYNRGRRSRGKYLSTRLEKESAFSAFGYCSII